MHLSVMLRASIVTAALACAALFVLPARAQDAPRPTLSLTGQGEISVAPDMATLNTGVETEAKTAREALDANNAAIAEVIAALKEAGIEARDIQTSGFRVQPRYQHKPDARDDAEGPRIIGYTVGNSVTVTVRDLARLGPVLDKVVSVGSNRIGGISFDVSDADKRLDEARRLAMQDAMRKADIYAGAAGVQLGPIQSITESGGYRPMYKQEAVMMRDAAASVPVEAGEQTLSVEVNVTWELAG
ncbi:SIMPL domain-containing protein [Microbaculum marinum]|uniref:SIMPL domain-containing protein n=1 Tax=Microbaculum marinum TaxID=1764581 RepID=A0AAW9RX52_9HYPH